MDDDKPLLEHLRETHQRLVVGPPVNFDPAVHGEFLYPIAWLDRHCERTSSKLCVEPGAIQRVDLAPEQRDTWAVPVAWAIDITPDESVQARNVVMCGAYVGARSQFIFYPTGALNEDTQGITADHLGVAWPHEYPCAPACQIEVFGPAARGHDLQVFIGNRNPVAVSGSIMVWGRPYRPR